jgi:hypothetical protein
MIEWVHKEKQTLGIVPTFYMASYFLDVVCATNLFPTLNLSWHCSKFHVYFKILCENKYKKRYIENFDREECPRFNIDAKKLVNCINN